MKAILTSTDLIEVSGGIEMAEKMIGKSRDQINIAVINEASAMEFGDHRFVVGTLRDLADNFGGSIEIIHLLALSRDQILERINAADMLFVMGGSTEWLKIVFDKTGFSEMLPDILKNKLYVGSSAGSMILGHMPSYKNLKKAYGEEELFGVERYLDLLDFSILPHLRAVYLKDHSDDWAVDESKTANYPVYTLSDKAAVVVDGNEVSIIGEDYLELRNGEIVRRI